MPEFQTAPFTVNADHWLDSVSREPLAGGAAMPLRRYLVMHFTSGWSLASTLDWWRDPKAQGNAHIVIERDGSLVQCRPFNRTASHAGVSRWRDRKTRVVYQNLNSCSIGIELCNSGDLGKKTFPSAMPAAWAGKPVPLITAAHRNGGRVTAWEAFPEAQLVTARAVAAALCRRYRLDDVLGHDDIAPDRKNDPGPAFNMAAFRTALGYEA